MNATATAVFSLLVALGSGCDKKKSAKIELDSAPFERCIAALEGASGSEDGLATVLRACAPACRGGVDDLANSLSKSQIDSDKMWSGLVECDATCSAASSDELGEKRLSERLPALASACGVAFFDLPKGGGSYLTDVTFILGRVHLWLQRGAPLLAPALRDRLERATAAAHFVVPPPSTMPGIYSLPPAAAKSAFRAPFYIVVSQAGVYGAASPTVRLRGATLEFRPTAGGPPPGTKLDLGEERASLDEIEAAWAGLHPSAVAARYVYIADTQLSVTDLLAAARKLGHSQLGLAVAGLSTRTHPVRIELDTVSAAPVLKLDGGEVSFPEAPDEGVTAGLRSSLIQRAPSDLVEIQVSKESKITDLIRALDIVAAASGNGAILRSP